ncbi:phage major capsid protein, HK97 [Bifidobacterium margollesii]|uniref:Phage major capsid protein, HK97 n=1 Tax=Bifidobacterium margollesii TaxID=2020964 RepID=A0A2N5JBH1_9BIFI|nr:hypothetical protein [Bifidobacterium margollesii]PLS31557.1 phage major capsid protein, HK97 [Bifidobacterium margollesii]
MVPYTIAVILPFSNQFRRDFDALTQQIIAKGPGAIARPEIVGVCGEFASAA